MSDTDEFVELNAPAGEMQDTAADLLEAAERLGKDVERDVQHVGGGLFRVLRSIAEEAGIEIADDEPGESYAGMKVADLHAEIDARNEGRDDADLIPADGKKADLIAALEADDETRSATAAE